MPIDDESLKRFIAARPIPDKLIRDLRETLRISEEEMPPDNVPASAVIHRLESSLTPAGAKVLFLASHGMEGTMIAEVLGITNDTVQSHLKAVRYALYAKNTTHAVALALRLGLLE